MNKELINRLLSSIIIIPITLFFVVDGSIFYIIFLSILFLVTSNEWIHMNKKNNLIKILGVIFLILSFYSAFQLRNYIGLNLFLFIIIICISTDIGGYIFGNFFKGPKLTKISPKKTYSGVIGSLLIPVIIGLIYANYVSLPLEYIVPLKLLNANNNFEMIFLFLVLLTSLISQIGDLMISYFKRLAKIKDTGKILPGHGGLLDRVDGLIFVIPTLYLIAIF